MCKSYWIILFSFAKQESMPFDEFLKYSKFNNRVKSKLKRIYNWSVYQKEALQIIPSKVLIYPFGGGDILYPLMFFNEIDEIIVIGLEPAGKTVVSNDIDGFLSMNLRVLYEMGYFRTKQMEKIYNYGIVSLMNQQLIALKAKEINIKFFDKGFSIFFDLNDRKKVVTYYSINLSNANESNWLKILKNYDNFTVFLKGASYILQQENFNKIQDFLIDRAYVILQDDTGFKYKFLQKNKFKIHLYGYYFEPLEGNDNFHIYFQRDLMLAYLQLEEINIFDISYNEENWLFAIK